MQLSKHILNSIFLFVSKPLLKVIIVSCNRLISDLPNSTLSSQQSIIFTVAHNDHLKMYFPFKTIQWFYNYVKIYILNLAEIGLCLFLQPPALPIFCLPRRFLFVRSSKFFPSSSHILFPLVGMLLPPLFAWLTPAHSSC